MGKMITVMGTILISCICYGWAPSVNLSGMNRNSRAGARFEVPAAVALSLGVQTMISLYAAGIPVLAPEIAAERGWNAAVIAFYPTVVYITALLISFQVPGLLVRMGGMGLGLACVAISAAGVLMLLPRYAAAAALASVAIGCATGAMNPASAQVLGPLTTARNAALVMSIKQTGVPLGGVVAGALVPILARQNGWRGADVELAAMGVAVVAVLLPTVRWLNGAAAVRPVAFRPLDPVKRLLAMPGMPTLLIASVTFNGMQLCLRSFFTIYLVAHLRLGLVAAGLAFSASQVAGMVGQVVWAAVSDRLLSVHAVMAIIGLLMTAASLCTAAMTPQWPLGAVIPVAAVYGVSAAGYIPVLLGEVARRSPSGQTGTLTSGAQLFPLGGSILGPLAFGGVAAVLGLPVAFVVAGLCTLAGAVVLALPYQVFAGLPAVRKRAEEEQV
jgi:MFS family permease